MPEIIRSVSSFVQLSLEDKHENLSLKVLIVSFYQHRKSNSPHRYSCRQKVVTLLFYHQGNSATKGLKLLFRYITGLVASYFTF
jgi:hypothetical protein